MQTRPIGKPFNQRKADSLTGMEIKTGLRIGLAARSRTTSASDFRAGNLPGGASILIDPTPLMEISQQVQTWLEEWIQDRKNRRLKKQGLLIDLPDPSRFYELDALRGFAILMMIFKHLLDGWGRVLSLTLSSMLLTIWTPLKVVSIAGIPGFFFASALEHSTIFDNLLNKYAPSISPSHRRVLIWVLAMVPGLWFGLNGTGASAFLFLSGLTMALRVAREPNPEILKREFSKKGIELFGLGLLVTMMSLVMVPWKPIYFGVLHLFGLVTVMGLLFISMPIPFLTVTGLVISAIGVLMPIQVPWWLGLGFVPVAKVFADYTPIIPFMGMWLLGMATGRTLYPDGQTRKYKLPDFSRLPIVRTLSWIGRYSLWVYLLQEPINLAGIAEAG